jgi:hypothetical protein
MDSRVEEEVIGVAHDWDRAMVTNDPEAIGAYMADDWTIIGPDGSVGDKATFLELVRSGALTHDVMESHDSKVRVYGDTAVVIAQGISGGPGRVLPSGGAGILRLCQATKSLEMCVDTPISDCPNVVMEPYGSRTN